MSHEVKDRPIFSYVISLRTKEREREKTDTAGERAVFKERTEKLSCFECSLAEAAHSSGSGMSERVKLREAKKVRC